MKVRGFKATHTIDKKIQMHSGKIDAFSDLISTNCVTLLPGAAAPL